MRLKALCLSLCVALLLLPGCGKKEATVSDGSALPQVSAPELSENELENAYVDAVELEIPDPQPEMEMIIEVTEAAMPDILEPVASGELVTENEKVTIDYSNTTDGYIMVRYNAQTQRRIKVRVTAKTTYTYNLPHDEWAVFPLSDGNGSYQFKVFENVSGSQYSLVAATGQDVVLSDEFAPFIRPNQFVNYSAASNAVAKAWELTKEIENPLGKVEAVYNFVVKELTYDIEKARTVKSGYIPVLDNVLEEKKGICFDYAALMTGMLRSQGIPCKMVFGYTGGAYHAWISVWTEDTGWVDGVIFFDGVAWQRLDPTFASYDNQSEQIMKYIGNGSNYVEKYFY